MSGVTKHIFNQEVRDILSMWDCEIKTIEPLLPKEYSSGDIITLLKEFYPHEWHSVEIKYVYYQTKDRYIKRKFGKSRYHMKAPEVLLMDASRCKKILSKEYQRIHFDNYTEESGVLARENLWLKRKPKIERVNQKIEKALSKVQQVTPSFIDQLIGLYERKNTSQKDRRYILLELKKYYSDKIIQFFFKLNDTELNKQLRWEAFYHLQSFNYQPRARRQKYMQVHTKNKKRKEFLKEVYPFETYEIPQNPNELEYRIENSREQKIKEYDFFISHSSKDGTIVQKLIRAENQNGKNIFCDWINDVDYLKRHLLCEATLKVLEKRMEQSKAMIFVVSENSRNSVWCKYELNYFTELGKPIYCSNGTSFDYDKRNYSTSHVHMMLSIALSRMIDKCESVFFLNSENSISIAEEISKERTASPWIYNELSLADMIEIRPINCYRDKFLQFSHRAYDAVNESSSLQIKYEVGKMLRSFISLSKYDLISCAKEWRANKKSFQSALDYIYLSKDIIIKQDVLIS